MNFEANDAIDSGTVTLEIVDDHRRCVAPVSFEFHREGVSYGFNMSASEAKRLALRIWRNCNETQR